MLYVFENVETISSNLNTTIHSLKIGNYAEYKL